MGLELIRSGCLIGTGSTLRLGYPNASDLLDNLVEMAGPIFHLQNFGWNYKPKYTK